MVCSVFMLSDDMNERLTNTILQISLCVKAWHTEQSRECRGCSACFDWFVDQRVHGKFMGHIAQILSKLSSIASMEVCGFVTTLEAYYL